MKTCVIMQPTYWPWLGYFDLIDKADVFIFLDTVQLSKQSWQVRNRIKTPTGALWLSIPSKKDRGYQQITLATAAVNDAMQWRQKHLKSIQTYYGKAQFFDEVFPVARSLINNDCVMLSQLTIALIQRIAREIKVAEPEWFCTSQLGSIEGTKDALLVNLCKKFSCDTYLSPQGSAAYIEKESPGGEFSKNNIVLLYHNYEHPAYPQLYGDFLSFMGIIDLLCNVGFKESLNVIRRGRRDAITYKQFRQQLGHAASK